MSKYVILKNVIEKKQILGKKYFQKKERKCYKMSNNIR